MQAHLTAALNRAVGLFSAGRLDEAENACAEILRTSPGYFDAQHLLGVILIRREQFPRARNALRKAVKLNPDSAEAATNLGLVFRHLNQITNAQIQFEAAIAKNPRFANAFVNLSAVLQQNGDFDAAIDHAQTAIVLNPQNHQAYNQMGAALIGAKQFARAIENLETCLDLNASNLHALCHLSEAYRGHSLYGDALATARRAETLAPDSELSLFQMAAALRSVGAFAEARDYYLRVLAMNPSHIDAILGLTALLAETGEYEQARATVDTCVSAAPKNPDLLALRAHLRIQSNDPEGAERDYRAALKVDPKHVFSICGLSVVKKLDDKHALVRKLLALMRQQSLSSGDKTHALFTLAKAHARSGNIEKQVQRLAQGNSEKKRDFGYSKKTDNERFDKIRRLWNETSKLDFDPSVFSHARKRFVFVLGMPRSGTTLTEQILAAHSSVFGAGELPYLGQQLDSLLLRGQTDIASSLSQIAKLYRNFADTVKEEAPVIIDKMPLNFRYVGFILKLFPDAKIVHLKRDPRAVCWSIYNQNFESSGNRYAYDLGDLANFYSLYEKLMRFWHDAFPGRIYDFNYERLTRDQEAQTRELLTHCGLEWEEACLEFHTNARLVRTASDVQVRQTMYTGSSDAWRRYEPHLGELFEGFEKFGVQMPDPAPFEAARSDMASTVD